MVRKRKGSVHMDKHQRKIKRKKEKKFQEVGEKKTGKAANCVDRISDLPEHLIHHILSRLRCTKDVARTSVLSRKWRSYCVSFQEIDLDQRYFHVQRSKDTFGGHQAAVAGRLDFMNHVNRFVNTRLKQLCCLNILRLHVIHLRNELAQAMNCCIHAAIQKDIKELDIHVKKVKGKRYTVPQMVFTSKTLTSLKLHGCRLNGLAAIELPNLRQLSMKKIPIDEGLLQKIFQSCPSIEDFRLVECMNLQSLCVPALPSLKRVEVHKCIGLRIIEIKEANLQTFCFFEKESIHYSIQLACYENLRNLTLKASKMTDEWFQEQILKFPDLENLTLLECRSLKSITILSSKLKRLSLIHCSNLEDANIVAPNLSSFEYTGQRLVPCISNLESSRLQYMKINFEGGWSSSLSEKFNESISRLEGFIMVLQESGKKDVKIYEDVSGTIDKKGSGYKIELIRSPLALRETIYRKLQECRPSRLCVFHSCDSKSIQLMEEILEKREESPSCCHYYMNKCWRHYLKDFKFSTSKGCSMFTLAWLMS